MQWIFLFTGTVMAVISIYHLFTHKHRKSSNTYIIHQLKDKRKTTTESFVYKQSIIVAYIVIFLTVFLFMEVFNSVFNAFLLFLAILILGGYVLITLDRVFEIQRDAIIFSGYHAKWGKIRSLQWGKKKKNRRKLIMELAKGQKIRTTIQNSEADELEEILSNYAHFEKD